jgi:type III secretion protein R
MTGAVVGSAPSLGALLTLVALALIPLLLMAGTSFVKASIVLSILRNALGAQGVLSGAVIVALSALLTAYVMAPVAQAALEAAAAPLAALDLDAPLAGTERAHALTALSLASEPLRVFLERNSGAPERKLFVELSARRAAPTATAITDRDLMVVLPAFLITELKEALQIGLLLLLPFLVVDLVIASVLAALGMSSLSPAAVALPLKLLVFLSVDGFAALSRALVSGYG